MTRHNADAHRNAAHQKVTELLPWYINGTLDSVERQEVEAHLAVCEACRDEWAHCRDLATAVRSTEDIAWAPSREHLSRLMARSDAAEKPPSVTHRWWKRLRTAHRSYRTMLQQLPSFVRWGLAAQGALILLLMSIVAWQELFSPAVLYRTLSDVRQPAPPMQGQIRVVFADDMTEAEMRALLTSLDGTIINGPSALGVYTVAMSDAASSPDRLNLVLATLRRHPKVRLAEPVVAQ